MYAELMAPLRGRTDLVLLPETFTSGFSNEALASAETMAGPTVAWMAQQARTLGAAVTGSVQIRDGDGVFNRLLWADADGNAHRYDKRHLFRMAGEHERYAAGRDRMSVDLHGWRVCPLVCYDLRFPVFSRNRFDVEAEGRFDYDLLLYVANWPAARRHAWRSLLPARAIENLAYVIAPAQGGVHENGRRTWGHSMVVDPWGVVLAQREEGAGAVVAELDFARQSQLRSQLPALEHRVL